MQGLVRGEHRSLSSACFIAPFLSLGASVCEAFGHISCWARQGDSNAPKQNAFGSAVEQAYDSGSYGRGWTVTVCAADTDSDGFTNGDELGDGCCAWIAGAALPPPAFRTSDISHPNVDLSVPASHPSCTLAGPPPAVVRQEGRGRGRGGGLVRVLRVLHLSRSPFFLSSPVDRRCRGAYVRRGAPSWSCTDVAHPAHRRAISAASSSLPIPVYATGTQSLTSTAPLQPASARTPSP